MKTSTKHGLGERRTEGVAGRELEVVPQPVVVQDELAQLVESVQAQRVQRLQLVAAHRGQRAVSTWSAHGQLAVSRWLVHRRYMLRVEQRMVSAG